MADRSVLAALVTLCVTPVMLVSHTAVAGAPPSAATASAVVLLMFAAVLVGPWRGRAGLAVTAGACELAGQSVLALATTQQGQAVGCLPLVGRGADVGLRLALVRYDPVCPHGTMALQPRGAALAALLLAAAAVVVVHLMALALADAAVGAVAVVRQVAARLGTLVHLALHRVVGPVGTAPRRRPVEGPAAHALPARALPVCGLRGPPLPV